MSAAAHTVLLDELAETIDLARDLFGVREVSCETNPNHLDGRLAAALARRVQRLSVGVQSFDDELLKINRLERFGSGEKPAAHQQVAGVRFAQRGYDLQLPGQSAEMLHRDIELVIQSGANQTTFYPLMTSPPVSRALKQDGRRGGVLPGGRVLRHNRARAGGIRAFDGVDVFAQGRRADRRVHRGARM
jgi:coproporphyrinogen III oxidase-like Fe-S oxidoreductase